MNITLMRIIRFHLMIPLFSISTCNAADLRMRLVYEGTTPKSRAIDVDRDISFCGKHPLIVEDLLINRENGGIANAVVYLNVGRRQGMVKIDSLNLPAAEKRQVELVSKHCRFEPRVILARSGDTLAYRNLDTVSHNPNISFVKNAAWSIARPKRGSAVMYDDLESEPAPIPIGCNIHPWMKTWLIVLDHRFVAISDENGFLEIKGLPDDRELVFRVWHEQVRFRQAEVIIHDAGNPAGRREEWKLNKFKRTLSAGVNDLGTVSVSGDHLPEDVQ